MANSFRHLDSPLRNVLALRIERHGGDVAKNGAHVGMSLQRSGKRGDPIPRDLAIVVGQGQVLAARVAQRVIEGRRLAFCDQGEKRNARAACHEWPKLGGRRAVITLVHHQQLEIRVIRRKNATRTTGDARRTIARADNHRDERQIRPYLICSLSHVVRIRVI